MRESMRNTTSSMQLFPMEGRGRGATRRRKRPGKDRMARRRGGWVAQLFIGGDGANGNEGINGTNTAVNDGVIDLDNQRPAWKSNM